MTQTKCLFLTGSFVLLLAAGLSHAQGSLNDVTTASSPSSPSRDFGFFNGSSVTLTTSTWDMRRSKELTFRTCSSQGTFLSQSAAGGGSSTGFRHFNLSLRNGTIVFSWIGTSGDVSSQNGSARAGEGLADNRLYTLRLKNHLGTIYLNISQFGADALFSTVVANSTFHSGLLSGSIGASDLLVGEGFHGCLYSGPGVDFKGDNVVADNVAWNSCPLQGSEGCTMTDQNDCFERPCLNGGTCVDDFQSFNCLCPRNFNGSTCEIDLARQNGCAVTPCENNSTCQNLSDVSTGALPYRCICQQGFTGVNCETVLNQCEKSPSPCLHGTCSNSINSYTCNCSGTGFEGANCSEDINECDDFPCGEGKCYNTPGSYSCDCPLGFDGLYCQDIDECQSSPCQNGGTCRQGSNNYSCICVLGYNGLNCEHDIDECQEAHCTGEHVECQDGILSYKCICQAGYANQSGTCEDINECDSQPCHNNATCFNAINTFNCSCLPGFTGTHCQTDIDECASDPCQNNATCENGINTFTCHCKPGFTSVTCSEDINECDVNDCRNGATCIDQVNGYGCNCMAGWTGPSCAIDVNECASNPCHNNATCNDLLAAYSCICLPGFTGVNCENNIDDCNPNPCENGGSCVDGINDYHCNCDSRWMGKNCSAEYDACSFEPCQNNATCATSKPERDFQCTCASGFNGTTCQTNIDDCVSNTCETYQHCYDGINNYTCACPKGYTGEGCVQEIDECASSPCQNGATCTEGIGYYNCTCPSLGTDNRYSYATGYTGVNCEIEINECAYNPPICENGAKCDNSNGSYQCFCPTRNANGILYIGSNCQTPTTFCMATGNPCKNGGNCTSTADTYICHCAPGYTDKNCTTDIDECLSSPCLYGGTCQDEVNGYRCNCIPGITGPNCETNIDDCEVNPCNLGSCSDRINNYECDCTDTGFRGKNCSENIDDCLPTSCMHNGTCKDGIKNYTCQCLEGYTGEICQMDIQECNSNPCHYNGTCLEKSDISNYGDHGLSNFSYATAAGYVCDCIAGITGLNCEENIDECESGPCLNNGTCSDDINKFTCKCAAGFTGTRCETDINECIIYQPCQNNATCMDRVANYTCQCQGFSLLRPNYGGRNCSMYLSGCVQKNDCQNGQCVPILITEFPEKHGYECLCNPGFTGKLCDIATTVSFNSNGSLIHFTESQPTGVQSLSFRFRTNMLNTVLTVYSLPNGSSVSVEIKEGKLMLVFHNGTTMLAEQVNSQEYVSNAEWQHVFLNLQEYISLMLESAACGAGSCTTKIIYPQYRPPVDTVNVFFGNLNTSLMDQTLTGRMFVGCMEDILLGKTYLFPEQTNHTYVNISHGCSRREQCEPYTCSRNGRCVDNWDTFFCDCDRPYWGVNCSNEYTAATFFKDGVVSMAEFNLQNLTDTFSRNLNFSLFLWTRQENSTIMYMTAGTTNSAFLSLEMQNGYLGMRHALCETETSFRISDCFVEKGLRNFVEVRKEITSLVLKMNGTLCFNETVTECHFQPRTIFIGKVPESSGRRRKRQVDTSVRQLEPFSGVLQDLELQGYKLDFETRPVIIGLPSLLVSRQYNLTLGAESTISVCSTENPCENEGNCTDVFFNDFQCDCLPDFRGKDCSKPDMCEENSCPSGASCNSLDVGFECIRVASFNGYNSLATYQSSLPNNITLQTISFNMRTRSVFGTLFETRAAHGQNYFIKVRVRDGSLEVNYLLTGSGFSSSLRMHRTINDGQWYMVKVTLDRSALRLQLLQNNSIIKEEPQQASFPLKDAVTDFATLVRNGSIRVGGAADREQPFNGCLEKLRVGGILLSFVSQNETNGNSAPQMFTVLSLNETGRTCVGYDACRQNNCLNGGQCQDTWNGYQCQCRPGYTGDYCQRRVDHCAVSHCENNGQCLAGLETYTCACPVGYAGTRCSEQVDICANSTCPNSSICEVDPNVVQQYTCNCTDQQYIGDECNISIANKTCSDCKNNATCDDGQATCNCQPGYTGVLCEYEINYCVDASCHNGTCTSDASLGNYTCSCYPGFSGDVCDTDINNCTNTSCLNGGDCSDYLDSTFCTCKKGWTGVKCENNINECQFNVCWHGTCEDRSPGYFCDCTGTGFQGENCTTDVDECDHDYCIQETTSNCTNLEGSYSCQCLSGYTGENCSEALCVSGLCENGTCTDDNEVSWGTTWNCTCLPFFGGVHCDIAGPCASEPCDSNNTQTCVQDEIGDLPGNLSSNYTCSCKEGWTGRNCSEDVNECDTADSCGNGGTCLNTIGSFECVCIPGYTGMLCKIKIDHCEAKPCDPGICNPSFDNYTCDCNGTGYKGNSCSENINECVVNPPCSNGECEDTNGSFTCNCGTYYLGNYCEYKNPCNPNICQNGGSCSHIWEDNNYKANCTCMNDYTGEVCEMSSQTAGGGDDVNLGVIIGPVVAGIVLIIIIGVVIFILVARDKRATRGAYSPSRQETAGARVELGNVLKKPPEERLI